MAREMGAGLALSNEQIERYSRQIILPQVGGRGQERLLAARIAILGEITDLESPLAYLVGAGVGTILLDAFGDNDNARRSYLIDQMKDLNPEVKVGLTAPGLSGCELALMLIGSAQARIAAEAVNSESPRTALIAARLDSPGEVVIAPSRPPCLACAGDALMTFGSRGENAELVKMVATTEAVKYLIQPSAAGTIIKFSGLSSGAGQLCSRPDCMICTDSRLRTARK